MEECKDCEFRGYSPQVCVIHAKHCRARPARERRPLPVPVRIGTRTLVGAGMGMAAVLLGSAAVCLVGGATVIHAVLGKLCVGAGLTGGGVGLLTGVVEKRERN